MPIELIAQALISGADLPYEPEELEALIIRLSDEQRGGGTWKAISVRLPEASNRPVKYGELGWEWSDGESNDGTVIVGPGPLGSFVRLTPARESIKVGQPFAPLARDFWRFIDESMQAGIGVLEAAEPIR